MAETAVSRCLFVRQQVAHMVALVDQNGASRFALDAAQTEIFYQRQFADLIAEAHERGRDYYIARVHCPDEGPDGAPAYSCYDARQLCKYIFELVISTDGRHVRIKNFKDPITQRCIADVNFFRLRSGLDAPLRAEFIGNYVSFLESPVFRNKLFGKEDALGALSVCFQFKGPQKGVPVGKKTLADIVLLLVVFLLAGGVLFAAVRAGRAHFSGRDVELHSSTAFHRSADGSKHY